MHTTDSASPSAIMIDRSPNRSMAIPANGPRAQLRELEERLQRLRAILRPAIPMIADGQRDVIRQRQVVEKLAAVEHHAQAQLRGHALVLKTRPQLAAKGLERAAGRRKDAGGDGDEVAFS